ncbi:hypothetical protein LCM20_17720 [Halobacillus litoralis]|uniref:hypothetical protein n=1 Tax=Halobacillus litoralis TaxID=45668 RepID=UPI001CD1EB20|nr:hypothetical protein [Halobacillus litoralis]MCA0972437.1 hypothetical protein [Halobacillus litoralis]
MNKKWLGIVIIGLFVTLMITVVLGEESHAIPGPHSLPVVEENPYPLSLVSIEQKAATIRDSASDEELRGLRYMMTFHSEDRIGAFEYQGLRFLIYPKGELESYLGRKVEKQNLRLVEETPEGFLYRLHFESVYTTGDYIERFLKKEPEFEVYVKFQGRTYRLLNGET